MISLECKFLVTRWTLNVEVFIMLSWPRDKSLSQYVRSFSAKKLRNFQFFVKYREIPFFPAKNSKNLRATKAWIKIIENKFYQVLSIYISRTEAGVVKVDFLRLIFGESWLEFGRAMY